MTTPRPKRPARVRPADVTISDRPIVPDDVAALAADPAPEVIPAPAPAPTEPEPTVGGGGKGKLTLDVDVQPVPGAVIEHPDLWIVQQYGTPVPTSIDEYVNGALLAVTDPALADVTDGLGAAARWAIEGITGLPARTITVAHPTSVADEQHRLAEQQDLRRALDTLQLSLTTRQDLIATAITAAGRNAPTEAPGGYRADLAGVVMNWLADALDHHDAAQRAALAAPVPAGGLSNADTLDALSAAHRASVGQ